MKVIVSVDFTFTVKDDKAAVLLADIVRESGTGFGLGGGVWSIWDFNPDELVTGVETAKD